MKPAATIIVPFRDAVATVGRCAASLACLRGPGLGGRFRVLFIDDGSSDRGARDVAARGFEVVRLDRPRGPGAARNAGARLAGTPWLVFLDADCLVDRRWAGRLIGHLERPGCGAVAGQYCGHAGTTPIQRHAFLEIRFRERSMPAAIAAASTCNFAVRRDLFTRTGGFSEDPALRGAEDLEFTARLSKTTPIVWDAGMGVVHVFRPTLGGYLVQQHLYARSAAVWMLRRRAPVSGKTLQDATLGREVAASATAGAAIAACATPLFPFAVAPAAAAVAFVGWRALRQAAWMVREDGAAAAIVSILVTVPRNAAWAVGAARGTAGEVIRRARNGRTP